MKGLTREQRKQLKADIVEYRKQDHYASECAEHFGVSVGYVHNACHGINYPWKLNTEKMSMAAKEQNKNIRANPETAIKHINKSAPWCEYVDGYESWGCYINVRCKTCGSVINISFNTIKRGTSKCPHCEKLRIQAAREKAEQERKAKAEERHFAKACKMKCRQVQMQICEQCGELFLPTRLGVKYCSTACMRKSVDKIKKDRRIRKIRSIVLDNDITLDKLYKRDNGICRICGCRCDRSDYYIRDDGTFIAGIHYPSIDHIIPISAGGKHAWDNVQLACRICNSKKSNRVYLPMSSGF